MHIFTNIVNTIWLKVYGYDYGMICFDTRFWYFTEDEENIFQHSKHKGYVWKVWLYTVYWRQEPKIIPHRIALKVVLAIVCSVKTSSLYFCASKWKIWQLGPHHKYNVMFLLVLGAAAQHFTRGGFAPSCLHFSAPFEVVQTHRPNPRSNVLSFIADRKGVPFLSFPPPHVQTISFKRKILATWWIKGYTLPKHQTRKDRPVVEIRNQSGQ